MNGFHDDDAVGRVFDARLARRFLPYARAHRRPLLVGVACLFGLFGVELAAPWLLGIAIDGPIRRGDSEGFFVVAAGYALVVVAAAYFRWLESVAMNRAGQGVIRDLRVALFSHLQRLPLSFHDRAPVGRLVTRVTSDVENLSEMITSGVVLVLYDAGKVLGAAAVLFWIDARVAAVAIALTPLLLGVSLWFRTRARTAYRAVRRTIGRLNAYLQEAISGVRVVQMFGREGKVRGRFASFVAEHLAANLRAAFYFSLFFPFIDLAVSSIWGASFLAGGNAAIGGSLSIGKFLQFWMTLEIFSGPIREIGEKWNVLQSAMASAERVARILDEPVTIAAPASPKRPEAVRGAVEFRGVSFGYDPARPVVKGISFAARPGETLAIVGATGAGKSTLLSLLCRFYDPQAGSVVVDGIDLREREPREHRARLGLVLQDPFLFAGTLRENLALGRPNASDERIARAAAAVGAAPLLERLPGGLDAPVAERGVTFSTGERQLLALARALAGDPAIVLLDEATANVDTETETRIQEGIRRLLCGRTAIVVAHRLSTIRGADRILVLHHGVLRESGTHEELLRLDGIYARLYRIQFGEAA